MVLERTALKGEKRTPIAFSSVLKLRCNYNSVMLFHRVGFFSKPQTFGYLRSTLFDLDGFECLHKSMTDLFMSCKDGSELMRGLLSI